VQRVVEHVGDDGVTGPGDTLEQPGRDAVVELRLDRAAQRAGSELRLAAVGDSSFLAAPVTSRRMPLRGDPRSLASSRWIR
jgi:hypothetical protein